MILRFCSSFIAVYIVFFSYGQNLASLRNELVPCLSGFNAKIGVSLIDLDTGDTLSFNDQHCFPTLSTYKFSQAVYVLHQCDKGKITPDQLIHITKEDLHPGTWSPLRSLYPNGNIDISIDSLLTYSVSMSDNNVCDILFDRVGSTKKVNSYLHKNGFRNMHVVATEYEMGEVNGNYLYENCSTPSEMSRLLQQVYSGKLLSEKSTVLLLRKLAQTTTGQNRLKSGISENVALYHKTGTSAKDSSGRYIAVNDVGILTIPVENGEKHIALSIFITDSYESFETNEYIIGKIAATVCAHYQQHSLIKREAVYLNNQTNRPIPVRTHESHSLNGNVVLLSGGYLSQLGDYDFIVEELAQAGYLVVEIQHDLNNDPPIATTGNIYEQRLPVWQRGDSTLQFVRTLLQFQYPKLDWNKLILIGHSNGGDISVLAATLHPEMMAKVITLDHRRMPLPLYSEVPVLSLRASDVEADPGVLPTKEIASQSGHKIIHLGSEAKHNELNNSGKEPLKSHIISLIMSFLQS